MRNKVQTNDYKINVLVECENSDSQHWSYLDFDVNIVKVLKDEDILEHLKDIGNKELIDLIKDWLKKQPGYAISNVANKTKTINYNDIVQFTT